MAQMNHYTKIAQKVFNWGFRAGFDTKSASQGNVYQNGASVNYSDIINQTGFQCALFGRINVGNVFMQPDIGYHNTREKYDFISTGESESTQNVTLARNTQSLNSSVLFGYNLIKQDAYLFNIYFGPSFRYNYLSKYNNEKYPYSRFDDRSAGYEINLTTGISANISYLYFDFRYEFVRPTKKYMDFSNMEQAPGYLKDVTIKETKNLMSFSIGLMF